jgi:hypothetical protein
VKLNENDAYLLPTTRFFETKQFSVEVVLDLSTGSSDDLHPFNPKVMHSASCTADGLIMLRVFLIVVPLVSE